MENMQTSASVEMPTQSNHKTFIYSLIVVAVAIIAGAIIIMTGKSMIQEENAPYQESDMVTTQLQTQGSSDEVTDIEADLNSTDLSAL